MSGPDRDPRQFLPTLAALLMLLAIGFAYRSYVIEKEGMEMVPLVGVTMGTTWSVKVVKKSFEKGEAGRLQRLVAAPLELVNTQLSTYQPTGDLGRLNSAPPGVPVKVGDDLRLVLNKAMEINRLTSGAFDVTVGPLVHLWGFHKKEPLGQLPDDDAIKAALALVGMDGVVVDEAAGTVTRKKAGMEVDLSAIAKGYAVDLVAAALDKAGYRHYMVEVGGEVRCRGKNQFKKPWRIGVERPEDKGGRRVALAVPLGHRAMATSGDYRSFFELNGKRYAHTIDPTTGRPVEGGLASVTVVADDCMTADGLATGFTAMGPKKALMLADRLGVGAYLILRRPDGTLDVMASERFKKEFLKEHK